MAALRLRGVEADYLGSVGDDPDEFLRRVEHAEFLGADLLLTTGAISVGKYDYVTDSLVRKGLQIFFKKVKIRPGKPLLFGRLKSGLLVLGLPGNPIATATGFRFFADPLLRNLRGLEPELPLYAQLLLPTRKAPEATCFLKAKLTASFNRLEVTPHQNQQASMTNPMLSSNAWIVLHENSPTEIAVGAEVLVLPFEPRDW